MKKVLITGGAGFIGRKLAQQLKKQNCNVLVYDNLLPQVHGVSVTGDKFLDGVRYAICDINDKESLTKYVLQSDIIIHLVSDTGTSQSQFLISRYCDVNITGTATLLEILNRHRQSNKKLILTSSRAVYGEGLNKKEDDEICPESIYGITKRVQEELIINSCPIPYTILRLQNVYGPGQSLINPNTGIINMFSNSLIYNDDIYIYDNDEINRDFIFIDDVVEMMIEVIKADCDNEIYNIGTSHPTSLKFVAESLKTALESNSNIFVCDKHRKGDVLKTSADMSKFNKKFKFRPKNILSIGLFKYVEWLKGIHNENHI